MKNEELHEIIKNIRRGGLSNGGALGHHSGINDEIADLLEKQIPKKAIKDEFKVLYSMNNETKERKYGTVYLTMVKELNQKLMDQDLSYVVFKNVEFVIKPSFVEGKSKEKYTMFELPSLNIPTSILK